MSSFQLSRRHFLKQTGLVGTGLIVGIPLSGCAASAVEKTQADAFQPSAFLQITPQNEFHFFLPRSEMGQGVHTGLTTIIAEELDVDPARFVVHHAPADKAFQNPEFRMQVTGGSTSVKVHYHPLRQAGAVARAVIKQAAAQSLGVEVSQLKTDNGHILVADKSLPYGDFVELANKLSVPDEAPLKSPDSFRYIGTKSKNKPRLDALAKSTGTADFGLDVDFPGLYRAALLRCPVTGGKPKTVNDEEALKSTGVRKVVSIYNGVAVIADSYWQARQAVGKLKVEWELPETLSKYSTDAGMAQFKAALDSEDFESAHEEGEGSELLSQAHATITADYWAPYLAHATMEPPNCTVKIENGRCDVWTGCQSLDVAQGLAAFYGDISKDDVHVHSLYLGGGFGRRASADYVGEAAAIAKTSGLAVQLIWSREDDIQHDLYRPAAMARFKVGLNKEGNIETWQVRRAGANCMAYTLDEAVDAIMPGFLPNGMVDWMSKSGHSIFDGWTVDPSSVEGLFEDYDAPNKDVQHVTVDPGLRVGFWRSVGHSFSGFFKESMMDELAHHAKQDPLQYRLKHTQNNPRLKKALEIAAEKSNWGKPSQANRFQGIAAHTSFLAAVAQVAEVSVENNQIRVHKVTCVIDCGMTINPDIVKAQMESGIIFGLTAALYGDITLKDGVVQQSNFHDYPMLRINEAPEIEVHIIDSKNDPTGVGEPGTPPIAGAVANAIFAATGKRLRSLPLKLA